MTLIHTRRRASLTVAGALVLAGGVGALLSPTASAHVTATAPGLTQNGYGVITFNVPNESDDNQATTAVKIALPSLKSARPEAVPGWTATVTKDPTTSEVTAVTWTAQPGAPGVAPSQFQRFSISAGPLPTTSTVALPATQTYADGSVVDWNQPPAADGSEPEHPAPEVTLAASKDAKGGTATGTAEAGSSTSDADPVARWLGGAGLVVGVVGLVVAAGFAVRRRA